MCTFKTNKIYLSWKKEKGGIRRIVAELEKTIHNSYVFSYIENNEALKEGFRDYPAFSKLEQQYSDNVLEIFKRRLVDRSRKDFKDFVEYWHCSEFENDDFALLGLTGARLQTDTFEFIAPHEEVPAIFYSELTHLEKAEERALALLRMNSNGQKIDFESEKCNKYDKNAIKVKICDVMIGYVKSIHCKNISDALKNNLKVSGEIASSSVNGTIKNVLIKVLINL